MNKIVKGIILVIVIILLAAFVFGVVYFIKEISKNVVDNAIDNVETINVVSENVAKTSAIGYIDAVEKQVMINQVTNDKLFDLSKEFVYDKDILDTYDVMVRNQVDSANVTIDTLGSVTHACIVVNDITVEYDMATSIINNDCVSQIVNAVEYK